MGGWRRSHNISAPGALTLPGMSSLEERDVGVAAPGSSSAGLGVGAVGAAVEAVAGVAAMQDEVGIRREGPESDLDEPPKKRVKIPDGESGKLEERLYSVLCCTVCLDLPKASVYQVNKVSITSPPPSVPLTPITATVVTQQPKKLGLHTVRSPHPMCPNYYWFPRNNLLNMLPQLQPVLIIAAASSPRPHLSLQGAKWSHPTLGMWSAGSDRHFSLTDHITKKKKEKKSPHSQTLGHKSHTQAFKAACQFL